VFAVVGIYLKFHVIPAGRFASGDRSLKIHLSWYAAVMSPTAEVLIKKAFVLPIQFAYCFADSNDALIK